MKIIVKNKIDRFYLLFLLIVFIILTTGLGSYGLAETSEARYAEISREMLVFGDYLNPELLGIFHFHKPPIAYYITTLGYRIFGINEFGARFFLQISIILQLLLVYRMTKLLYKDKLLAFLAGLLYFSLPIVLISSRNLTTDSFLTTFILASLYCWQLYLKKDKLLFLYFFYIIVGISLLTKGPVALLFIITYIITDKVSNKGSYSIHKHHILGLLLCIVIGGSWYVLVINENPKLWDYFVKKQLISRVNSNSFNRSKPFWYFVPILIGILFPWWIMLFKKLNFSSFSTKPNDTKILIISSVILIVIFSLFSTKLLLYILPIFWMIAIVLAAELLKLKESIRKIISNSYLVFSLILSVALIVFYFLKPKFISVSLSDVFIIIVFVTLLISAHFYIKNQKVYKPTVFAAIFGAMIVQLASSIMANNSAITNSTKDMVKFINAKSKGKEKTILVYNFLLTSIPFYSENSNHITIKNTHYTAKREIEFEKDDDYKKTLWDINDEKINSKLEKVLENSSTFLLLRNKNIDDPKLLDIKKLFMSKKEYPKWTLFYNE